ncbi:MAG: hypothetical protein H0T42_32235 [Deltaproteobacteria bacterium]|nr:hypothetical protein [Deltaproteobacteria bacterium]
MGARSLILPTLAVLGGCSSPKPPGQPKPPAALADRVVADFEAAVKQSKDAYVALFDFAAVGEYEILLHRYDLNGRLTNLTESEKAQFSAEDGTPYPAERERKNVGNFYTFLAQRTVGTGGCVPGEPRTSYGKMLGKPFEELPEGTPAGYETLRIHANEWLARGGVVGFRCSGGTGGLALVFTARDNPRGYDLITIYDD